MFCGLFEFLFARGRFLIEVSLGWLDLLGSLADCIIFQVVLVAEVVGAWVFFGIGGMLFLVCRLV